MRTLLRNSRALLPPWTHEISVDARKGIDPALLYSLGIVQQWFGKGDYEDKVGTWRNASLQCLASRFQEYWFAECA